jgi:hypothetical protein
MLRLFDACAWNAQAGRGGVNPLALAALSGDLGAVELGLLLTACSPHLWVATDSAGTGSTPPSFLIQLHQVHRRVHGLVGRTNGFGVN